MIINYFKTAWRNLIRNRFYTVLNIAGLSIGLSVFILVLLFVNHEQSYDQWNAQLQHVYRVGVSEETENGIEKSPSVQYPLGSFLQSDCPEVEAISRTRINFGETIVQIENEQFYEANFISADSNFFRLFPYHFVSGNPSTALNKPNTIVLSKNLARKYFGNADPIGKQIKLNSKNIFTVSAVVEKPGPSHLNFEACLSYHSTHFASNWFMRNHDTYILLKPKADITDLTRKANSIYARNYAISYADGTGGEATKIESLDPVQWLSETHGIKNPSVLFELVKKIHLDPQGYSDKLKRIGVYDFSPVNGLPVFVFSLIGILVLLLACINYTNMSIARGDGRAKESGVRKLMGASRKQLASLFLTESFLLCLVAVVLSLSFSFFCLNLLNTFFHLDLHFFNSLFPQQNTQLVLQILGVLLLTTFFSGIYPAFVLSAYKPVTTLKGNPARTVNGNWFRKGLIVFQYGIACCFIISLLIITLQLKYIRSNDPGFKTEQVLRIETHNTFLFPGQPEDHSVYVKNKLSAIPGVQMVSTGEHYPGMQSRGTQTAKYEGDRTLPVEFSLVNYDYFKTLGMSLLKGRDFSRAYGMDSTDAAVINETAARKMGFENTVGREFNLMGKNYRVIGVVKDAHLTGYESKVIPQVFMMGVGNPENFGGHNQVFVKVARGRSAEVMKKVISFWKDLEPGIPVKYSWLDQDFAKLFKKHEQFGVLTLILAVIAVFIAIIGIFALSAYTAQQRKKEIGIRKVLGSSVQGIVRLLSREYIWMVLTAFIIASPMAWWATDKWLQDFAYRIEVEWWMFALAGIIAILIALITISFQSIKAALMNPVTSLRAE